MGSAFKGNGPILVTPALWDQRLASAESPEEVVGLARDFLASWHPADIAALPESCWPPRIKDADDVNAYAFQLVHARFRCQIDDRPVECMSSFFTAASHRLSQLIAAANSRDEEDDEGRAA
jgi:hypothetical protein